MNKSIFMGRLTRDPEIRYNQNSNKPIARFSLAVDRKYKREGQAEADFFNFVGFDKTAEFIEKYLWKGTKVLVESHAQNNNYTGQDGAKVYSIDFLIDNIEFAESKASQDGRNANCGQQGGYQDQGEPQTNDGFMDIPEGEQEGLPF